jgi:hypothetical protein
MKSFKIPKREQTIQWPKKINKRTNTHLQNTTQRSKHYRLLIKNIFYSNHFQKWYKNSNVSENLQKSIEI